VHGKSELLEELFGKELGDRGYLDMTATYALVALEERLVGSIKDKERVDVESE